MKKFFFAALALAMTCGFSLEMFAIQSESNASPPTTVQDAKPADQNQDEKKIRFTFQEQDWQDVIPWFADQAGYSLQPISDWPEGTFTLKDDSEYTVLEALDQLNHALLIRTPEPYTLIRNRNMLVLWKTRDANFPDDLIETVKVEDLDKRGKYETISAIFDVGELNAEEMFDELKPMIGDVHRNHFAVFPAANQLHIRETGGQLRDIRDLIKASQSRVAGQELTVKPYRLKHQDAETFMLLAGPMLGIPDGSTNRDDDDLAISIDPFGERMFVRGTSRMLKKFEEVAALVDSPDDTIDSDVVLNEPYLKAYPVFTDPELALKILDTMMEGLDVRMDQDEITGAITVLATKENHQKVENYLEAISSVDGEDFAIITLERRDPAEVIVILQTMFPQSTEGSTEGPVLMAQSELYQILVRGTPQEVATVKKIVQELDDNANVVETGPRSGRRIIDMSPNEQDDILPMLEDLLYSNNRTNSLNIIMPEERKNIRSRIRNTTPTEPSLLDIVPQSQTEPRSSDRLNNKGTQLNRTLHDSLFLFGSFVGWAPQGLATVALIQDDEVGQTSDEAKPSLLKSQDYKPAPQMPSIPGAPIEVRATEYGIVLDSKDLDALDDLEQAIYNRLGEESSVQLPQFFPLNHRPADEMLTFLETYYGLVEAGGGGGGGGMMAGMMNNMMGGGAGDLLGGLLGGGADIGGTATLEGDVQFGVDMAFNMVYVRGATGNDVEEIALLIDTLDRPDPPHNPQLIGGFYTIDVNFRDPTELKTIIEKDLSELLDTGEQAQGGGQNAEAAQMMKMMQQLTGGGGRRGGSSADLEKEKPKGKLGVDPGTKKLLVTGPNFIYLEVLKRVELLDVPGAAPPIVEVMEEVGNLAAHVATLKAVFGDKVELIDQTTGETIGTSSNQTASAQTSSDAGAAASAQADAMRKMIEAARAQQQARGGGDAGGRTGGNTGRGGGATRGGGARGGGATRGGGGFGGGGRGR